MKKTFLLFALGSVAFVNADQYSQINQNPYNQPNTTEQNNTYHSGQSNTNPYNQNNTYQPGQPGSSQYNQTNPSGQPNSSLYNQNSTNPSSGQVNANQYDQPNSYQPNGQPQNGLPNNNPRNAQSSNHRQKNESNIGLNDRVNNTDQSGQPDSRFYNQNNVNPSGQPNSNQYNQNNVNPSGQPNSNLYNQSNGQPQNGLPNNGPRNDISLNDRDNNNDHGYQNGDQRSASDQEIRRKIHEALGGGWFSKGFQSVHFDVNNGNVILKGSVDTLENKKKIEENVKKIDGVKQVNNQITIAKEGADAYSESQLQNSEKKFPQDTASSAQDRQLNAKIRDKLNNGWFSKGYVNLVIRTTNGIVVISGTVDKDDDIKKITDQIKVIEGVKSVNPQLNVKSK